MGANDFADRKNPADPLNAAAPPAGAELLRRMAQQCDGFSFDDAAGAAANMLINVLRQQHATAGAAEDAFDQIVARSKEVLLGQHYRPGRSGARIQGTFAFRQGIVVPAGIKAS